MSEYFEIGSWWWIVGNWILFKMSFGWVISHKVWESYAWSKLSWLFLQNPNLATFESWWIMSNPWWIMINPWSNDEIYFKMRMLTKNLEVWLYGGHSWLCPNIVNFWTFEQLTEQNSSTRLETWHGWSWEYIRTLVSIWNPLDSSILMQHETLIWGWLP